MRAQESGGRSIEYGPAMGTPTAERVVQILDFLTTHPGRGFTLSEIARQLRLSKTTTYKILGSLTDRSLVLRNADTSDYRLGPALVAMGGVAERNLPALTYAKREADQLAEQHDAECVVVIINNQELLIVHHAGIPGPSSTQWQEGQRQPLAPPMGTVALAWGSPAAVEAWLDRPGLELTDDERRRYREAVDAVRRRGYAIGMRVPSLYELHALYASADLHTPEGRDDLSRTLTAFAHENFVPVDESLVPDDEVYSIAAPVFGPDGTMLFAISLLPGEHYRGRDIPALAREVVRAAGRVMTAIDGRQPSTVTTLLRAPTDDEPDRPSGGRPRTRRAAQP